MNTLTDLNFAGLKYEVVLLMMAALLGTDATCHFSFTHVQL